MESIWKFFFSLCLALKKKITSLAFYLSIIRNASTTINLLAVSCFYPAEKYKSTTDSSIALTSFCRASLFLAAKFSLHLLLYNSICLLANGFYIHLKSRCLLCLLENLLEKCAHDITLCHFDAFSLLECVFIVLHYMLND